MACIHFVSRLANNADMYWSKDRCKESLSSFNEDRNNFEYFLHEYVRRLKDQDLELVKTMPEHLVTRLSQKCVNFYVFTYSCLKP